MKRTFHRILRGAIVHGGQIWISELFTYLIVGSVILTFFILSGLVIVQENRIRNNDACALVYRQSTALLSRQHTELLDLYRIMNAITLAAPKKLDPQFLCSLAELVYENSKTYGYDPLLVLAVIEVESVFKNNALGRFKSGAVSGAMGLMQIQMQTAFEIATDLDIPLKDSSDILKPEINVALGVAYLTREIAQFKSFKLGLLAYNQGPATIRTSLSTNTPLSVDYYNKVLKRYYRLKKQVDTLG